MKVRRASLLLAAIVATVILAYELRVHVFLPDHSFPELIELAPANSTFIAYIDVAELRKDPLIESLAALAPPVTVDPDYEQFVSSTGFDYRRDLDQIVITAAGDAKLAIADGRFDRKKIEEYASRSGAMEKRNGHTVYVIKSKARGQTLSLAFLSAHRIVLAEGGDFAAYLSTPRAPLDPAMRERLSRVSGSPAFAGWKLPDSLTHAAQTAPLGIPALQSLRAIDFALKPGPQQLLISVEGECEGALQAQNLSVSLDLLRTILPGQLAGPSTGSKIRGHTSAAENAALAARLAQAIEITTNNERVRLLLSVSPDMISAFAGTK